VRQSGISGIGATNGPANKAWALEERVAIKLLQSSAINNEGDDRPSADRKSLVRSSSHVKMPVCSAKCTHGSSDAASRIGQAIEKGEAPERNTW